MKLTVIMPIYNGATTLKEVFESLERQKDKGIVGEIILINDCSTDNSADVILEYQKKSTYNVRILTHSCSHGLASSYNEGISETKTPYFLLMHQDIILTDDDSFVKALSPLTQNSMILASFPNILHTLPVWKHYNFWQKCLFSRFIGRKVGSLWGKFDCYNKELLSDKVGLFDSRTFRTAGEDGDIFRRVVSSGYSIVCSGVEVIHIHNNDPLFGLKNLIKKEAQLAEGQGVLLRRYGIERNKNFILAYFRLILVGLLFIPYIQIISLLIIMCYSVAYTGLVYRKAWRDVRIICLPFINVFLLLASAYFTVKGFIVGKQQI